MSGQKNARTRGFTLVELLTVIAIMGVLMALLFPAIQAAREAARRAKCQSNMRQLGLAAQAFHEANGKLPPGQAGGKVGFGIKSRAWSWIARALPQIEQGALYKTGDVPNATLADSGIIAEQIAVLLCPSDPYSKRGPRLDAGNLEGVPVGQTNYKAVSGANWGADASQPGLTDIGTDWKNPGTNGSYDGLNDGDGMMWRTNINDPISLNDATDGTSHTFLIGEDLPAKNRWCCWPYASNTYGTCAIPPNHTNADPGWWPNTHSFRSNHPGGLQFTMADGSSRFVEEDIDLATYRALATRAGGELVRDEQ